MLTHLQAVAIGLLKGVTELVPMSRSGHSVLVPAWLGGDWHRLVTESATDTTEHHSYPSFIVGLHLATAVALPIFFRGVRIVSVRWLTRYFETRTLIPFAIYCLLAGIASIVHFA